MEFGSAYCIEKRGSTYYAIPRRRTGLTAYSGTVAHTVINNAITALNTLGRGLISVLSDITTTGTINGLDGVILDGNKHSITMSGSSFDVIKMAENFQLQNFYIDCTGVSMSDNHGAILFDGADQYVAYGKQTIVQNMNIRSSGRKGCGIYVKCDADDEYIQYIYVRNINTWSMENAIRIHTGHSGAWANALFFDTIKDFYSAKPFFQDHTAGSGMTGHYLSNFQLQAGNNTDDGLYIEGDFGYFYGTIYDVNLATNFLTLTSASSDNYIVCRCSDNAKISDSGDRNIIINQYLGTIWGIPRYYEQSAEPTLVNDTCAFWKDTDDNKYYLIKDVGGTAKKIELT